MNILHCDSHLPHREMKGRSGGVPSLKKSYQKRVLPMDMTHVGSNPKTHTLKESVIHNSEKQMPLLHNGGITPSRLEDILNLERNTTRIGFKN